MTSYNVNRHLETLVAELRSEAQGSGCVSFNLFVNSQGYKVEAVYKTPADLEDQGVTMKNLAREWVNRPEPVSEEKPELNE